MKGVERLTLLECIRRYNERYPVTDEPIEELLSLSPDSTEVATRIADVVRRVVLGIKTILERGLSPDLVITNLEFRCFCLNSALERFMVTTPEGRHFLLEVIKVFKSPPKTASDVSFLRSNLQRVLQRHNARAIQTVSEFFEDFPNPLTPPEYWTLFEATLRYITKVHSENSPVDVEMEV